jgi:hypothetical protein
MQLSLLTLLSMSALAMKKEAHCSLQLGTQRPVKGAPGRSRRPMVQGHAPAATFDLS